MSPGPSAHVVVAGGGIAGLEAILALRVLAGGRVRLTLVTDAVQTLDRPASVSEPFERGVARRYDIRAFAADQQAELVLDRLVAVRGAARIAVLGGGRELACDALVVAVGARTGQALEGAIPFTGPRDIHLVREVVEDLRRGAARSVAFVLPGASIWPVPAYELALMTGAELRAAGVRDARVTVVTPEPAPLAVFGAAAPSALEPLLVDRGVDVRTGARVTRLDDGEIVLADGKRVPAERAVALAAPAGNAPAGLPTDERGFVPVDEHGRVAGLEGVYAAGDVTAGALKQGGLAAQQADAAAASIAAQLGAIDEPAPYRPVVRGVLLVGGEPLYLRANLGPGGASAVDRLPEHSEASSRALWSPPAKVAARYLAPYFATARPASLRDAPLADLPGGRRPARR